MSLARRTLKGLAMLALLGVAGFVVLLASLAVERKTELTLPAPTGPYAVGRTIGDWTDSAAVDSLAPVPGTRRELLVWIWYPSAAPHSPATVQDYVPKELRPKTALPPAPLIFRLVNHDLSKVHAHSVPGADLAPRPRSFPIVIMRGGASSGVLNYTTLAEDLASYGYVVVGFDAPYRTGAVVFPDGRVIMRTAENNPELVFGRPDSARAINRILTAWTRDIAFVLDRLHQLNASDSSGKFTGRLDLSRVGVFGHSLGGAEAAQFCHDDVRCKAGIDVDGAPLGSVVQAGVRQPFMFLMSDHGDASDAESRQIMANIRSIYDRLPADRRLLVAIRGANHFTFSDDGALLKSGIVRGVMRLFGVLGIDGRRQLAVTAYCLRTFFDAYLVGRGDSRPAIASPQYPEIRVLQ